MEAKREAEKALEYPTEADIDAVLYEAKGDACQSIRMLLSDLDALARDRNDNISKGYVYGRLIVVRGRDR